MPKLYNKWKATINKDGPDYSIITKANGYHKKKLENDLITHLGYYEILSLGLMKSKKSLPHIKKALKTKSQLNLKGACARALWDIEGDSKYISILASLLADKNLDKFERMKIIGLFTNLRHPKAFTALESVLLDPDYLIRRYSASIYSYNKQVRKYKN